MMLMLENAYHAGSGGLHFLAAQCAIYVDYLELLIQP